MHVPCKMRAYGGGEVANTEEDGPFRRGVLLSTHLQTLLDTSKHRLDKGLHPRAHGGGEADSLESLRRFFR